MTVTVIGGDDGSGRRLHRGRDFLAPVPAAMLNPGVLAVVVASAAAGHTRESGDGLPWSLSFVVAPLILHRGTREALPNRISTHLPAWVSRQPAIRAGFPSRASSLVGPVRQGLRFGLRHSVFSLGDGVIEAAQLRPPVSQPHLRDLVGKAMFVGRWLSKLDQPSTAFALFGVTV